VILAFNGLAWGFEHVPFDAALLASLIEAFPDERIHFFGERDHCQQVLRYLQPRLGSAADITWGDIKLPPRLASPRQRLAADLRIVTTMLSRARALQATRVVACYVHWATGVLALKALQGLYRRGPIGLIHHGSLLQLVASRRFHPLASLANGRLRQIVLAEPIRAEVARRLPRLGPSLRAIRHPYFFEEATPSELPTGAPMTFSFLGLIDETKGFDAFAGLAATFGRSHGEAARFDLIGGTRTGALPASVNAWVKTYGSGGPIPRDVFERQLRQTTYAVFPFDPVYYRLVASGSVLDALAAGKPFIALRNPQLEELLQAMGDIGYLCDSVGELEAVVAGILREPPRERYRRQSENILARRQIFGATAVAAQLREILAADEGGGGARG